MTVRRHEESLNISGGPVQVSPRPECRQYNVMGDFAGAGRKSSGSRGGDNRSHSRVHKRHAEDVPALSVSTDVIFTFKMKKRSRANCH